MFGDMGIGDEISYNLGASKGSKANTSSRSSGSALTSEKTITDGGT